MTHDEIIQQAGSEWNKLRGTMNDYLANVIRLAREDEREACAKVCDAEAAAYRDTLKVPAINCAAAIRARRNNVA